MIIFKVTFLLVSAVILMFAKDVDWISKKNDSGSSFKIVCYYPMSAGLNFTDKFPPGFNSSHCTHLLFIPFLIDGNNNIVPQTKVHSKIILHVVPLLRKQQPALKIMASSGGKFDPVMESMKNISQYVKSALHIMARYDFDGLDLDWEYPGWDQQHKPYGQVHNFSIVLTELRKAFDLNGLKNGRRYILSTAVCKDKPMADKIYEYNYIKNAVDFVNMMGYDFFGPWVNFTDYNSPLYSIGNETSLSSTATFWSNTIGADKVVVGFPFYCHSVRLINKKLHSYHAPAFGKGDCDVQGYTCPCQLIKNSTATSVWDDAAKVPYIYYGDQWVSYENEKSVALKAKWIKENKFAGLMIWNMKSDDYEGVCDGKTRNPLMTSVIRALSDPSYESHNSMT